MLRITVLILLVDIRWSAVSLTVLPFPELSIDDYVSPLIQIAPSLHSHDHIVNNVLPS